MSYADFRLVAESFEFQKRIAAAAGEEFIPDPINWAANHNWHYAATPTWADKWRAALDAGTEGVADDNTVITDAEILAAVKDIRAREISEDTSN